MSRPSLSKLSWPSSVLEFRPMCEAVARQFRSVLYNESVEAFSSGKVSAIVSARAWVFRSLSESPSVCRGLHIKQFPAKCLGFTCSSATANVFISAISCTWPSVSRCTSVSAYARVWAKISSKASKSTSPSVSPSALTFAFARFLASVLFCVSTFTPSNLLPSVWHFGHASTSPGILISASVSN